MQGSNRDADIENRLWTHLGKEKVTTEDEMIR